MENHNKNEIVLGLAERVIKLVINNKCIKTKN